MRLVLLPPALALSSFLAIHDVTFGESKILLPSMLSGMFFGSNTPESPVVTNLSASAEAAAASDAPSAEAELNSKGSADLVPKEEVVQEFSGAPQADSAPVASDVIATENDSRAAKAEAATEEQVSAASQGGGAPSSTAVAGQEAGNLMQAEAPVNLEKKEITEEDAAKNSELLQSVSGSAETSWISRVTRESATEALLPLVALTPVLAAAGFHADIETSASGVPLVRFPSIDYAVEVEDLQNYN